MNKETKICFKQILEKEQDTVFHNTAGSLAVHEKS